MKRKPLVTIIINNYNYGGFIQQAIDSALGQTYENIEVVVVDDGSADHSREVIERYGHRVIPLFKENGGQGSAYNAGFLKARGEYVCMLDADDTLLPTAMEKAIPVFEEQEVIKVQWPLWTINSAGISTGGRTAELAPPQGNLKDFVIEQGPFYDFKFHVGNVVRRKFLESILPMPEPPYRNGGDVYLTTLAPIYGLIRHLPEPLGTYRIHGSNNFFGRQLTDDRIRNYITRFETNCSALQQHLDKMAIAAEPELWKKSSFNYLWPSRLLKAKKDIESLVPEGQSYILINQEEWGEGEPVPCRRAIPFTERDGGYGGPPVDDDTAIEELERLRNGGAGFLIYWWTCFWWFDHYRKFSRFLSDHYPCTLTNDRLVVFDLGRKMSSAQEAIRKIKSL